MSYCKRWLTFGFFATTLASPAQYALATPSYPIIVQGGDERSFTPSLAPNSIVNVPKVYDAIIVGAGLGGLSSALYLSDQGKSVLLLEKENNVGGLASSGQTQNGTRYDRGAAYWTNAYEEEKAILDHIGLGNYEKLYAIHEPIDSYFLHGHLYEGIWDDKTVEQLPASFAVFKSELTQANEDELIPDQPLEEAPKMDLDAYSAAQWIRQMPARLAARTDEASKALTQRLLSDASINHADPMADVIDLMDLYCRSALGTTSDKVSALAFANFYISEIVTRYTTQTGTADAAELMEKALRARPELVTIVTSAPVGKMTNLAASVQVLYSKDGTVYRARGKYGVFAGQLKVAAKLIEGFDQQDPARAKMVKKLKYADYAVHAVRLNGHPYRATYDTWTHADHCDSLTGAGKEECKGKLFTDFILGRWMDPGIDGYLGMRDFSSNPKDNDGVFTIYHPLPLGFVGHGFNEHQAQDLAEYAVNELKEIYSPLLHDRWNQRIDVTSVETSRWPYSVHVAEPGHYLHKAKVLRKNLGRIFFANNNLGTPAFEEALFRGHCAADNVLARLIPGFVKESWSKCPMEK